MRRFSVPLIIVALSLSAGISLAQPERVTPSNNQNPKPELIVEAGHGNTITGLAASIDGKLLASISKAGGTVKIWEVANGRELKEMSDRKREKRPIPGRG